MSILGKKSAYKITTNKLVQRTYYASFFKQGADLMPRTAVVVDIQGPKTAKILSISTSEAEKQNPNNKKPWKEIDISGNIESEYLFSTLKSDSVLQFTTGSFSYIAIPVKKTVNNFKIISSKELARQNHLKALKWFSQMDKELYRLGKKILVSWLSRKNKLIDQSSIGSKSTVVYGAGGKNSCAAVVDTTIADFCFVNDQTLYQWKATNDNEAWYVCGMLNSEPVNQAIKGHQPSGQFGEQHVHKLPLSLIPQFNEANMNHQALVLEARKLSSMAKHLASKDKKYLDQTKPLHVRRKLLSQKLSPMMTNLNKLATEIMR